MPTSSLPATILLHALLSPVSIQGFLLLVLLLGYSKIFGQTTAKNRFWKKFHPDSLVSRNLSLIPVPILQSSPETGLKGGLALDYFFNMGHSRTQRRRYAPDTARTRDSYAFVQAVYSTRRQLMLEGVWQMYTAGERYVFRGRGGYLDFSEYYWGIGNETAPERGQANIFYERYYLQHRGWRKIENQTFVGFSYQYSDTRNLRLDNQVNLPESIPGARGGAISGFGPSLLLDYRDNPFSPTRGWYAEWTLHSYCPAIGSQYTFTEQLLDARRYLSFKNKSVLGFQLVGHFTNGTVPLRELPRLGGPNMLRGFTLGRYRDRQLWSAQSEYRRPLNRLLVGAVFVAMGGVAESVHDFSSRNTRYAAGAGMRVLVNKKKNLYSRVDLALNSNQTFHVYFRMMDAF